VPYYHVVFTLPAPIADIAYQNKAVVYDLLFKVSAETMLTIAADPRHLGARIGIASVLHSWGSALTHHPHVHMIVPGGGISLDGQHWVFCRPGFFLPFAGFATWLDMTPADPDMFGMPDPDTLIQLPWKAEVGWLATDPWMCGKPVAHAPRNVLKRLVAEAAAKGYELKSGVECEFFLIRRMVRRSAIRRTARANLVMISRR